MIDLVVKDLLGRYELPDWCDVELAADILINGYRKAGVTSYRQQKLREYLFPNKNNTINNARWLLMLHNLAWCCSCEKVLNISEFRKNKAKTFGIQVHCKVCHQKGTSRTQAARTAKYKASLLCRIPGWADLSSISKVYAECPKDMQVDHILPLNGETVSGLHVECNLQYLTPKDNQSKGNRLV